MEQSILKSVKKMVNVGIDDTAFDFDITMYINSEFSILTDLGIGPDGGFVIEDDTTTWESYFTGAPYDPDDPDNLVKLSKIKTCLGLRTRLLFDPPTTSFHLASMERLLQEYEWRLNVNREAYAWVDPTEDVVLVTSGFGLAGFGLEGFGE